MGAKDIELAYHIERRFKYIKNDLSKELWKTDSEFNERECKIDAISRLSELHFACICFGLYTLAGTIRDYINQI